MSDLPDSSPRVPGNTPVFFSSDGHRWRAFRGALRLALFVAGITAAVMAIAVIDPSATSLPRLRGENDIFKQVLKPDEIAVMETDPNRDFRHMRKNFGNVAEFNYGEVPHPKLAAVKPVGNQIRAGFYVNWDAQSWYSLRRNIDQMNMLMPEWFFVPDEGVEVVTNVDERARQLMGEHGVSVVPMVSNYFGGKWNGANVRRILSTQENRSQFIESLVRALRKFQFKGVNIDFEELEEDGDESLVAFMRELYQRLHGEGLLVTMDVSPLNEDYNMAELAKWNDYLMLMAYDMHFSTSSPGPIAAQLWVEALLDKVSKTVPLNKTILGVAAYGYDWPEKAEGGDVTFQEAIVTAKLSKGVIRYDNDNYNLTYTYADDQKRSHTVWFTDAATVFNAIRTAEDFGVAGTALWRLGSEDRRVWKFYKRDLSVPALQREPFDVTTLEDAPPSDDIDYEGEGEVLDVVAVPQSGKINIEFDAADRLISEEEYQKLPTSYVIKKYGKVPKQMILTFDDGPDGKFTPQIMKILRDENVPAAFFVVGINAEENLKLLRLMYHRGYEIGNHTFTHPNLARVGAQRMEVELNATRRLIECITGHSTVLFRPPYNADSEPESLEELYPVAEAKKYNYITVGESIDPRDWEAGISAATILRRTIAEENNGSIILLHDAGGDRTATVEALPEIIHYFKNKGYTFTTIAAFLGKSRDDLMPPLQGETDRYLSTVNWRIAEIVSLTMRGLAALFFVAIIMAVTRTLVIAVLAIIQRRRSRHLPFPELQGHSLVSIIVPAYNEEVTASNSVRALLGANYPQVEIVFVDDGSTDRTCQVVKEAFSGDTRVRVMSKPNGGKASALNYGISHARGEFFVCIDADTHLCSDAVSELLRPFADPQVGAVAGNVRVGNERNMLTRWQGIEYITSQNLDRRAFDLINGIMVVPGAIGAFRRSVLLEAGGFSSDTLAEDCDLTISMIRAGYRVRYNEAAVALTEAPETVRMFIKQRFRWSFGIMQNIWKHRDLALNPDCRGLGLAGLPNALVFQFMLPLVAPLADVMMICSLCFGFWQETLVYYLVFTGVDILGGILAFRFEREPPWRLWLLFPQRFFYRQIMCWVLLRACVAAIRGGLVGWGVLHRTGAVDLAQPDRV